ncbi:hypothetical protein [Paracoccus sp. R86501]|uniref:hypothetical protein n=1 Tax=Paracoccus sp. R86501 TaxID=3101711 RepID=UPI003671ACBC
MTALGTFVLVTFALGISGATGWLAAMFIGLVFAAFLGAVIFWMAEMGTQAMEASDLGAAMPSDLPGAAPMAEALADPEVAAEVTEEIAPSGDAQFATERAEMAEGRSIYGDRDATVAVDATPDDLQAIKGVGVKIAEALNEAGVTRFDQIAAWDEETIDAFASRIGRGAARIRGDDWVGQARELAKENRGVA